MKVTFTCGFKSFRNIQHTVHIAKIQKLFSWRHCFEVVYTINKIITGFRILHVIQINHSSFSHHSETSVSNNLHFISDISTSIAIIYNQGEQPCISGNKISLVSSLDTTAFTKRLHSRKSLLDLYVGHCQICVGGIEISTCQEYVA